jgi:ABC-2 type transport system permease protein
MPKGLQLWGLFTVFVTMAVMAIARKQQDFKVASSIPTTPASY